MASARDSDFYVNVTSDGCRDEADERLSTHSARHQDDAEYTSVLYARPEEVMSPTSSSSNGSGSEFFSTGHQLKNGTTGDIRATNAAAPTSATATETETDSDLEESRSDADKEKEHVIRAMNVAEDKSDADAEATDDEECKGLGETGTAEEKDQDRFKLAIALDFETDTNAAMSIGPPSVTRQTSSSFSDLGDYEDFSFSDAITIPNGGGPGSVESSSNSAHLPRFTLFMRTRPFDSRMQAQGNSVMIHCSDGWDRTPQLTAMVQLLLDPYYRTVRGLLCLIEKEWCSFGHLFRYRYGHGEGPGQQELEEQSPVFIQWLDALWQIWRQQPWAFEFNEALLSALYESIFSGLYGNFLYNNERQRKQEEATAPTRSLWFVLLEQMEKYLNVEYDSAKNFNSIGLVLPFSSEENDLVMWANHLVYADPVCRKYE
ncbi:hypothetical protein AM588_10005570 [Phytophthora nicotianae]|uniref:Myotubularin phosphatase domain-containing protein n=1 Tax=Phytophthora nicotianae TaxID=4792 RepID=A0A0W8CYT7_PHYNI|nr:hypothetical protein AM588_10005570 [Phytophthora nicotianae]